MAEPKYLGRISFTYEMVASILNLSNELTFVDLYTDPVRQIVDFVFQSNGLVATAGIGRTFAVPEGSEIPRMAVDMDLFMEGMRERVRQYDIAHGRLTNRELITELKEE
jgi:hypothetical protein